MLRGNRWRGLVIVTVSPTQPSPRLFGAGAFRCGGGQAGYNLRTLREEVPQCFQHTSSWLLRSNLWVTQYRLVIAPAVEDADDRHGVIQYSEGNNDSSPETDRAES